MSKTMIKTMMSLALAVAMVLPASAMEMSIEAPSGPEYGKPDSIEVIHTTDGGKRKNEDISKNAALIPPGFGTPSADTLHTGEFLTPNLAPGGMPGGGAICCWSGVSG